MTTTQPLTEQEAHLYDRQLRVWGVEAQYRLRQARVLLLGPFNGLASEIAKNLTLAGVKYIDICEGPIPHLVTPQDLSAHLFLDETHIGKERAAAAREHVQALNPLVTVTVIPYHELRQKGGDGCCDSGNSDQSARNERPLFWGLMPASVRDYRVICLLASDLTVDEIKAANELTRQASVPLIVAHTFGMFGYFITDALEHRCHVTKTSTASSKSHLAPSYARALEQPSLLLHFPSLSVVLSTPITPNIHKLWHILRALWTIQQREQRLPTLQDLSTLTTLTSLPSDLLQAVLRSVGMELSPVCALVGGIVAQEIIKLISGNDAPLQNIFLYDGFDGEGVVEYLGDVS